ncbi:nesprin-1 isoform X1 [Babesia caballi]|uniref:Nesprin-1 isoform X1 n=1 Tax=Babesia caballi TaxID=5871 RepID=A0AAV4LXD7_BABCB|nr:nesprin-1 isoform X1 [Babesia caballi]
MRFCTSLLTFTSQRLPARHLHGRADAYRRALCPASRVWRASSHTWRTALCFKCVGGGRSPARAAPAPLCGGGSVEQRIGRDDPARRLPRPRRLGDVLRLGRHRDWLRPRLRLRRLRRGPPLRVGRQRAGAPRLLRSDAEGPEVAVEALVEQLHVALRHRKVALHQRHGPIKHVELLPEQLPVPRNVRRLAEGRLQVLRLLLRERRVDLVLHVGLHLPDQKVPDDLGHRVAHVPEHDGEVDVEPPPDLLDELRAVPPLLALHRLPRAAERLARGLGDLRRLLDHEAPRLGALQLLLGAVHHVLRVVGEDVQRLALHVLLQHVPRPLRLLGENLLRQRQDLLAQQREPGEDALRHLHGQQVERLLDALQALDGRRHQLLQLRQNQILEGVRAGEAGQAVPLVHLDGLVDFEVRELVEDLLRQKGLQQLVENGPNLHPRHRVPVHEVVQAADVPALDDPPKHLAVVRRHLPEQVHPFRGVRGRRRPERLELGGGVFDARGYLRLEVGQHRADVPVEHLRQLLHQRGHAPEPRLQVLVYLVLREVLALQLERLLDGDALCDILLRAVLDPRVPQPQGHLVVLQHGHCVGPAVHQVDFGDDAQRPDSQRVGAPRQLERVAGGHVDVGGHHRQDDRARVARVAHDHLLRQRLDVVRLVAVLQRHPRDPRQVDEREVGRIGREDREDDWVVYDPLVHPRLLVRQLLDVLPRQLEVVEPLAAPLEYDVRPHLSILLLLPQPAEPELHRPPRHDPVAPRQKVDPHDALQHAALPAALRACDANPRQVDVLVEPDVPQLVLIAFDNATDHTYD